jgi:hypothetical protein
MDAVDNHWAVRVVDAGGIALGQDPVLWSRVTTLGLEAIALVLVTRMLLRAFGAGTAWAFALFYAGWTFLAAMAISGMENNALFCVLAIAAWLVDRRSRWAGVALGVLALMRPEGAVMAVLVGLGASWRDRAIGALIAVAGFGALTAFYGSPIPQSLIAKASSLARLALAGRHWYEWIVPFAFGRWPATTEGSVLFAMAVVTGPAVAAGASRWLTSGARPAARGARRRRACGVARLCRSASPTSAWYLVLPVATMGVLAAWAAARDARAVDPGRARDFSRRLVDGGPRALPRAGRRRALRAGRRGAGAGQDVAPGRACCSSRSAWWAGRRSCGSSTRSGWSRRGWRNGAGRATAG